MDTFIQGLNADVNIVLTLIVLFTYNLVLKDPSMSYLPPLAHLSLTHYYEVIF